MIKNTLLIIHVVAAATALGWANGQPIIGLAAGLGVSAVFHFFIRISGSNF